MNVLRENVERSHWVYGMPLRVSNPDIFVMGCCGWGGQRKRGTYQERCGLGTATMWSIS